MSKKKYYLFFILIILILILFSSRKSIEIISLNGKKIASYSIYDNNIIELNNDEEVVILNEDLYVPLNKNLKMLFNEKFVENENQIIEDERYYYKIDYGNDNIIVSNKSDVDVDNSVKIEIENYKNEKYIPLYVIANIPKILVRVNGTDVYIDKDYHNAIECYKNNGKNVVEIFKLGKDIKSEDNEHYYGENLGTLWREAALTRIEKYRKKDVIINVINQNNIKINNVNIKLRLLKNNFNFGTSVRTQYTDINFKYKNYFNTIGDENIFKWNKIEDEGYANIEKLYKISNTLGMRIRFHNLLWDINNVNSINQVIVTKSDDSSYYSMNEIKEKLNDGLINNNEAAEMADNTINKYEELVYNHIENETRKNRNIDEIDVINEPLAQQYFKNYLFDKKFLEDDTYKNKNTCWRSEIFDNKEYYSFLAKCFDIARKNCPNSVLIINDNYLSGKMHSNVDNETIKILNNLAKYTDNIDAIGIQYHVRCKYIYSPQSYYNEINYLLENNNIVSKAEVTEYDNYEDNKYNYSKGEQEIKANYLRDSLINVYSNPNIIGFNFWVFNTNHFTDAEKESYIQTVKPWIDFENESIVNNGSKEYRLIKGEYSCEIDLPSGKSQTINFEVSEDSDNIINVIFNNDLKEIKINKQPKINYFTNEQFSKQGSITALYDDDTNKEIPLTDKDIIISDFDTSINGKKDVKIQYLGCETEFTINVIENIEKDSRTIIDKNNKFKEENRDIFANNDIEKNYDDLVANLRKISNTNDAEINKELILKAYEMQFELSKNIISKANSFDICDKVISNYINISSLYQKIFENYSLEQDTKNDVIENSINNLINRYNDNLDIDFNKEAELIYSLKEEYNTNSKENNFEKNIILRKTELIELILEKTIKKQADDDLKKVNIQSDKDLNELTNEDIIIGVDLPNEKSIITNNDGKNQIEFSENGEFTFKINIRGYDYEYKVTVNNIDKKAPEIKIDNSNNTLSVDVKDENLKEMHIQKDGKEFTRTKDITAPGIYKISATDKANNVSISKAIIYGTYKEGNEENKHITIDKVETKAKEIKENSNFAIKENGQDVEDDTIVKTGDILISNNQAYTIVVKGDLTNSGKTGIVDLIKLRKQLVSIDELNPVDMIAADLNNDNVVNIIDLITLRKKLVE